MNTKLSKELAQRMIDSGDQNLIDFALENYPELGDITMRIKTFADVCKALNVEPSADYHPATKIEMIVQVLNDGKKLNWNDSNQRKYYPYFYLDNFRFVCSLCYYSYSVVSARMCYVSKDTLLYAVKQFEVEYKEYYTKEIDYKQ